MQLLEMSRRKEIEVIVIKSRYFQHTPLYICMDCDEYLGYYIASEM